MPGPGVFGVIVIDKDKNFSYNNYKLVEVYTKQFTETTNNICELKAILYSFLNYGVNIYNEDNFNKEIPIVYSDSNYCVQTFNEWMFGWANKGWIKSDKKTPENLDLIKAYYDWYQKGYRIELRKVKGHAGNKWNEVADKLATGELTTEEVYRIYG